MTPEERAASQRRNATEMVKLRAEMDKQAAMTQAEWDEYIDAKEWETDRDVFRWTTP